MLRRDAVEFGRSMSWNASGQGQEDRVLDGGWTTERDERQRKQPVLAVSWRPTPPWRAACALETLLLL